MRKATAGLVLLGALSLPSSVAAENSEPKAASKEPKMAAPHIVPQHFLRTDGRRIESGLRIESSVDRVRVARKVFQQGGEPQGLPLPEHLGGGFLFFQPLGVDGATYTAFYRAKTWTGKLTPLGRIPFAVQHVALGFDRIYALGVSLQAAFDLETGQMLPLQPLPPLATISGLAFEGPRRAIVSGPLVGVLYTKDTGLTWKRVLGAESIEVDLSGSRLFVRTPTGLSLVNDEGEAVEIHSLNLNRGALRTLDFERILEGHTGSDSIEIGGPSRPNAEQADGGLSTRDMLERKWISVLTRGAPYKGAAIAVDGGQLLTLELSDGLHLKTQPSPALTSSDCIATTDDLSAFDSPLFVCRGPRLQAFRLKAPGTVAPGTAKPKALELVWEGAGGTEMLTWGNGAVLLAGDCSGRQQDSQVCHVSSSGARALRLPQTGKDSPRAYATTKKGAYVIWYDRKAATMKRAELGAPSAALKKVKAWDLPSDHSIAGFLKEGAMLPRASVTKEGLNFWATHREKFVGVLLGDSENPAFGAVQRPLRRAIFDGPRAVLWGAAGFAKQSIDGGQTFEELSLPYRSGDSELAAVDHERSAVTMGCTKVGCALGRLLKLGWTVPKQTEEEIPETRPFPISGSTRFRFTCGGLKSSPPRRAREADSFPHFWEKGPPSLSGGDEGSSVNFPGDLASFYAWGPADASWGRTGRAQVMFVDPWDGLEVRHTAPTMQVFSSALDAKTRLGLVDPTSGFRYLSMDPDGRGGVMIFRSGAATELFVFEEGQPLEHFAGAHELGLRNLAGAVRSRSSFVAAFVQGPVVSLVRLSGGAVQPLVDFNLGSNGERGAQLVRTAWGDMGLALEGDDGLFVYPVSEQGELGEPIVTLHRSNTPPACSPEATGYIVDRELAVAPYMETTSEHPISVSRVRAKMIVGYGKVCIDSLRAEARDLGELPGAAPRSGSIPLSIFDGDADGHRSRLICE